MTQQDKDLLLRDLSARLPYGVKAIRYIERNNKVEQLIPELNLSFRLVELFISNHEFIVKPYLRPISSMTKDEEKEYNKTLCVIHGHGSFSTIDTFDYLLSHHFDVHDLIPKGLAIAITDNNNPYK